MLIVLVILSIPVAAIASGAVFLMGHGLLDSVVAYSIIGISFVLLTGYLLAFWQRVRQIDRRIDDLFRAARWTPYLPC